MKVQISDKDTVFRSGLMGQSMKAGGEITKLTEEADLFMRMETCLRETGKMIKLMGMEFTRI